MNKRSLRIILDTSFLLPILGFKTNNEVMNTMDKLRKHEVHYSDLSIIEALWKILKLVRTDRDIEIILYGLKSLIKTIKRVYIIKNAVKVALNL